jgi:hypothetical protein
VQGARQELILLLLSLDFQCGVPPAHFEGDRGNLIRPGVRRNSDEFRRGDIIASGVCRWLLGDGVGYCTARPVTTTTPATQWQ